MKGNLIFAIVPLMFFGCQEKGITENKPNLSDTAPEKDLLESAVEWTVFQDRNGDFYIPNTDKPFSGWAKRTYVNGQVEILAKFTNGSVTQVKQWHENGIPRWDISYAEKSVKFDELPYQDFWSIWSNYKIHDGTAIVWYSNGNKQREDTWRVGGHLMEAKVWLPTGEPCPLTKLKSGNGTLIEYYLDGQKQSEENHINGKLDGICYYWYENGNLANLATYTSDIKNGKFEGWHENGKKHWEETYKNGKKVGETIFFNEESK